MIKKPLFIAAIAFGMIAAAQSKNETFYVDGVKTETMEYQDGLFEVLDTWVDGERVSRAKSSNGITVSANLEPHKAYGRYIAVNMVIYNGTDQPFNFIPSENLEATIFDGKNTNESLEYLEYQKIVKRRQNGSAILMGVLGGMASMNAGTTNHSGYVGGTYYSGSSYSSSLAYLQTRQTAQDLADFTRWQADSFLAAKDSYLKSNTVNPGESVSGHILIPTKRIGKGAVATAIINVGGVSFPFSGTF